MVIFKNLTKVSSFLVISVFLIAIASAVSFDNPYLPIVKPDPTSLPEGNVTINVSVNSSKYWDTTDQGPIDSVGDIVHSGLSNLAWSIAGHFIDTDVDFDGNDILDAGDIYSQNIYTDFINATTGNFTDIYVSNNTIYIGDQITLSANGATGSILNVSGGNVSADTYFGSGKFLTDINLSNVNGTSVFNGPVTINGDLNMGNNTIFNASTINASNFYGGVFDGLFNFWGVAPWLSSNQTHMEFNETHFNSTVQSIAGITQREESVVVTTVAGTVSDNTITGLGFYLKEIKVVPTNPTDQYRFEAIGAVSGDTIDANRKLHTGTWNILKDISLSENINFTITNANPDSTFNVTFKYLSQNF